MNITQVEKNLEKLVDNFSKENFIYDLLRAYVLYLALKLAAAGVVESQKLRMD